MALTRYTAQCDFSCDVTRWSSSAVTLTRLCTSLDELAIDAACASGSSLRPFSWLVRDDSPSQACSHARLYSQQCTQRARHNAAPQESASTHTQTLISAQAPCDACASLPITRCLQQIRVRSAISPERTALPINVCATTVLHWFQIEQQGPLARAAGDRKLKQRRASHTCAFHTLR